MGGTRPGVLDLGVAHAICTLLPHLSCHRGLPDDGSSGGCAAEMLEGTIDGETKMAVPKSERLVIHPAVPLHRANQIAGLWK
jgi:hypothetical protein